MKIPSYIVRFITLTLFRNTVLLFVESSLQKVRSLRGIHSWKFQIFIISAVLGIDGHLSLVSISILIEFNELSRYYNGLKSLGSNGNDDESLNNM